jgi:hypothetical protein
MLELELCFQADRQGTRSELAVKLLSEEPDFQPEEC